MAQLVWLVPLLPLLASAAIALRILRGHDRGDAAEPGSARLATGAALLAFVLLVAIDISALQAGAPGHLPLATWFASGDFVFPISFSVDGLSLPIATLVAVLAWLTQLFAVGYLHREPGFHRFFMIMGLFTAGMLLIVLAGNAALTFVGWELAGVSSYLLIGYAYERTTATTNALRVFVTNRVGDAGFLLAIALAAVWLGSVEWPAIGAANQVAPDVAGLAVLGFVLAALVKSAQVPFAFWIARALEGPTPSSAIFYGAVMVHAGVYLLLRLEPLLQQTPTLLLLIATFGLLTTLYGWLGGLVQTDVKSALIFATSTQVGLMFFAIGIGLFEVAAWHLGLHAVWRAYQFLASPSYMHLVDGPAPPPPAWLSGCRRLYTAALQRFWLEGLADRLFLRPTQSLARDVRAFDDEVVSRLVGMPDQMRAAGILDRDDGGSGRDAVIRAHGLAGALMAWVADHFHHFEVRLVLTPGGGVLVRLMRRLGEYLLAVETLLEQPRYLLLLIMATFAVIL